MEVNASSEVDVLARESGRQEKRSRAAIACEVIREEFMIPQKPDK
jgi:hypothetical protein